MQEDSSQFVSNVLAIVRQHTDYSEDCDGQQVNFLIGNTGAGKSTSTNFLCKRNVVLFSKRIEGSDDFEENLLVENPLEGCEIGHDGDSQTTFLRLFQSDDFHFCDTPGFDDTKGITVDVANAIAIGSTMRSCKSVRFILIIPESIMLDRGVGLANQFQILKRFLKEVQNNVQSILAFFTKNTAFTNSKKISAQLEKLSRAEHFKPFLPILNHVILLVNAHNNTLILSPASEEGKARLPEVLRLINETPAICRPRDVLMAPLSEESSSKLILACRDLAVRMEETFRIAMPVRHLEDDLDNFRVLSLALGDEEVRASYQKLCSLLVEQITNACQRARQAVSNNQFEDAQQCLSIVHGFESLAVHFKDLQPNLRVSEYSPVVAQINSAVRINLEFVLSGACPAVQLGLPLDILAVINRYFKQQLEEMHRDAYKDARAAAAVRLDDGIGKAMDWIRGMQFCPEELSSILSDVQALESFSEHVEDKQCYNTCRSSLSDSIAQSATSLSSLVSDTLDPAKTQSLKQNFEHLRLCAQVDERHAPEGAEAWTQAQAALCTAWNRHVESLDTQLVHGRYQQSAYPLGQLALLWPFNEASFGQVFRAKICDIESRLEKTVGDVHDLLQGSEIPSEQAYKLIAQRLHELVEATDSVIVHLHPNVRETLQQEMGNISRELERVFELEKNYGLNSLSEEGTAEINAAQLVKSMLKLDSMLCVQLDIPTDLPCICSLMMTKASSFFSDLLAKCEIRSDIACAEDVFTMHATLQVVLAYLKEFQMATARGEKMEQLFMVVRCPTQGIPQHPPTSSNFQDLFTRSEGRGGDKRRKRGNKGQENGAHPNASHDADATCHGGAGSDSLQGLQSAERNGDASFDFRSLEAAVSEFIACMQRFQKLLDSRAIEILEEFKGRLNSVECEEANRAWCCLEAMKVLQDSMSVSVTDLANAALNFGKDVLHSKRDSFEVALRSDEMESAVTNLESVRRMLDLKPMLEITSVVQQKMDTEFQNKTSRFNAEICDLLQNKNFQKLFIVMKGHKELEHSVASARTEFDAAYQQIVDSFKPRYESALLTLQAMIPSKKLAELRIVELGEILKYFFDASDLFCLFGADSQLVKWHDRLQTLLVTKILSIEQYCTSSIRNMDLRGFDSSITYLESLQVLSLETSTLTTKNITDLNESVRKKIRGLRDELEEAMEQLDYRRIDKIFHGIKKGMELNGIDGISLPDECDELHSCLESKLRGLCKSIQKVLDDNNIRAAHGLLEKFQSLLVSETVKATEFCNRLGKFQSEMEEIKRGILTPRLLREDPEKIHRCLEGFKEVDPRFYKRQCAIFLDKLKSEVDSCAEEVAKRDVDKLKGMDRRLKDLNVYEVALCGLGYDSEIRDCKEYLFNALVDSIKKTSETIEFNLSKSKYDGLEDLKLFFSKALPILKNCDLADEAVKDEFVTKYSRALSCLDERADGISIAWNGIDSFDLAEATNMEPEEFVKFLEELQREGNLLDSCICKSLASKGLSASKAISKVAKRISEVQFQVDALWTDQKYADILRIVQRLQGFSKVEPLKAETMQVLSSLVDYIIKNLDGLVGNIQRHFTTAFGAARSHVKVDNQKYFRLANSLLEELVGAQRNFLTIPAICPHDREETVVTLMTQAIDEEAERSKKLFQSWGAVQVGTVVTALASLWTVPSEISNLHVKDHARTRMREILRFCQDSGKRTKSEFNFTELAAALSDLGARGGEIVEEFSDVFRAFNAEKFKKATARMTPDDALDKLVALNKHSPEIKSRLAGHYQLFDTEFKRLRTTCYDKEQERFNILVIAQCPCIKDREKLKHEQLPPILANIFAVWSMFNSGDGSYATPHPVQVFSILCLLGLSGKDSRKSAGNFILDLISCIGELARSKKSSSGHLVQLKTGEGKSLVLGALLTLLARMGFEVDCVCYSKHLSSRDYQSFLPVFAAYRLDDRIHYDTFASLSTRLISRVCDVREGVRRFITGEAGSEPLFSAKSARKKILLIDEVDVFFSEEFYGKVYSASVTVSNPQIEQIQRCVWQSRSFAPRDITARVTDLVEYKDLTSRSKCAHVKSVIDWHINDLISDVKLFEGEGHEYEVSKDGRITYADQDAACSNMVRGYMTLFAYCKESERGRVKPEAVSSAMGLQLKCGNFSFADIPLSYDLIMGVTGTLETLADFERKIIEGDYNLTERTLMPSIYGDSRLVFREGIDVHVEADLALYNRKIKEEILAAQKAVRAVMVFFESEKAMDAWLTSGYAEGIDKLSKVTRYTPNIDHYVKQATRPGSVTLFSAIHGRGLDFVCHDKEMDGKGGVHVVQAFLSEQLSEEVQIKGRTARQDKKGTFKIVVCCPKLEKFGIKADEVEAARREGKVYELLDDKRKVWFAAKAARRTEAIQCARHLHDRSCEFQKMLLEYYGGKLEAPRRQELMLRIRQSLETFHDMGGGRCRLLCLSDATGSMESLWDGTKQHIKEMLRRIEEVAGKGRVDLRWMAYRDYDQLKKGRLIEASEWTRDVSALVTFLDNVKCTGGGDFEEAIEAALAAANKDPGRPTRILLFGDAPPHSEKKGETVAGHGHVLETDWAVECDELARKNIPIFTFQVGDNASTRQAFDKMASATGGLALPFKSAEDLLNSVCLQALDQVGGLDLEDQYREKYMGYTFSS